MLLTGGLSPLKQRVGYERQQPLYQGEVGEAPITTVKAWMERLPELIKDYSHEDVLNMDTATERTRRKGKERKRWKTK